METIAYRTFDKSNWGKGAWQNEPDKKQWLNQETGYPCLIRRNNSGILCGYVGISEGHPFYKSGYEKPNVEVHGGLTYAGGCTPDVDESRDICHQTDGDDQVWWLGLDCHHAFDFAPAYTARMRGTEFDMHLGDEEYRDFRYVTHEVESLARQLKVNEA